MTNFWGLALLGASTLTLGACSSDVRAPRDGEQGAASGAAGMAALGGAGATSGGTAGASGALATGGTSGLTAGGSSGLGGQASGGSANASGAAGSSAGGSAGGAGAGGASTGGASGEGGAGSGGVSGGGAAGSSGVAGNGAAGGGFGGVAGSSGAGAGGFAGSGGKGGAGAGGTGGTGGTGYQPCPATGACKIMPFGDSITEGYPNGGGYRVELFRLAHQASHAITFVGSAINGPMTVDGVSFPRNHEGHGGYTIEDEPARNAKGIAPLVSGSMRNYTPHIVTLAIGTNDLNGNIDVADAPNRLGALLDAIYAENANVLVVLAQIVPTRTDGTNQVVRTYNAAMPALVTTQTGKGRHIVLVDMYGAFTRDTSYKTTLLGDNLHPNDAGYARMGETWYAAVVGYLH